MAGKVIVSAVSLILVLGVAIGVIVVVHNQNNDPNVAAHQKAVQSICQNTQDQKVCHDTLTATHNENISPSDPKGYIGVIVKAGYDNVIKALNMTDRLKVEHANNGNGTKMALDDCKDLLESALDSLEATTNFVHNNNIQGMYEGSPDFRNWLSAVIAYQQTCMDGFDEGNEGEKKVKELFGKDALDPIGQVTGVALDIVADLSNILGQFNLKFDLKPASRRLLAAGVEVDEEGFPTWFSAADRKLLGKKNNKNKKNKTNKKKGHKSKGLRPMPGVQMPAPQNPTPQNPAPQVPGPPNMPVPNVVVAQDGSGQFKTIQQAIDSYPNGHQGRYVIYVKAGVYVEQVSIPKNAINILMYGDGATRTIVTGHKSFPVKTLETATFANNAFGFIAYRMGFENTAGPQNHQAVAFRNAGDQSAFFECAFHGFQDTLYAHANRQFYRNCEISGTIDFIFGTSSTLIQNSLIIVRKPLPNQFNTVTADGTVRQNQGTGIVIQNCDIVPGADLFPDRFTFNSYLGRPWKAFSTTVIMESRIGDLIHPEGWFWWSPTEKNIDNCYYAEFANVGPGAIVDKRVKWKGYRPNINKNDATRFTAGAFLRNKINGAAADIWLRDSGVPFQIGFFNA